MKKIFESINLDIQEVADFIEENGLSFICNDKMQVETSEEDFEKLIRRFPEIDYVEASMFDTMQEFADFINESGEWPADAEDIIVQCGWVPDTGSTWGVCHNDDERVIIDDDGKAIVVSNRKEL